MYKYESDRDEKRAIACLAYSQKYIRKNKKKNFF